MERTIAEMGYAPNVIARNLSRGHSHSLGVVTAGLTLMGPSRTLNAIAAQAEEEGYTLLLKELPSFGHACVRPILDSLLSNRVDGIIWAVAEVGANREWLAHDPLTFPVPILFLTMAPRPSLASISIDNRQGGRAATQHLLEEGHRHIGHISGPLDWWEARERLEGWREALAQAGIEDEQCHLAAGDWSSASGEAAYLALRARCPEMDAVFVANDQMALGALHAARREGLRVPDDLGVVGYDNLPESAYYLPPLTSVDCDLHQLGYLAVRELVRVTEARRTGEPDPDPVSLLLPAQLVVRESALQAGRSSSGQGREVRSGAPCRLAEEPADG